MKLPKIRDFVFVKDKRRKILLRVTGFPKNVNGVTIVAYEDSSGLEGACTVDYWWKKVKDSNDGVGRLGSESVS